MTVTEILIDMNNTLRIKETEEQKVYVSTDTHLNHDRPFIWESRGYLSSKDHTDSIITDINSIVRPNDILIHCGDFCLNTTEKQFEELLSRILCQNIYYIWGNHNNPLWNIYRREVAKLQNTESLEFGQREVYPFRYRNMVFMGNYIESLINGRCFVFAHYPIYVFNFMKDGAIHCCGHSHYNLPLSQAEDKTSKIIDVGWDGFRQPYSIKEIIAIADTKGTMKVDHHKKD